MGDTRRFRTQGGAVLTFDLPLSPVFADQVRRGELVEVADNAPAPVAVPKPAPTDDKGLWVEYAVASGATNAEAEAASKAALIERFGSDPAVDAEPSLERPAQSEPKAAWVAYAVRHGGLTEGAADAMTKNELIDQFGAPRDDG